MDCRYQGLIHLEVAAQNYEHWMHQKLTTKKKMQQFYTVFKLFAGNDHEAYIKFGAILRTGLPG